VVRVASAGVGIDCANLPPVEVVRARPFLTKARITLTQNKKMNMRDIFERFSGELRLSVMPSVHRTMIYREAPRNRGSGAFQNQKASEMTPTPSKGSILEQEAKQGRFADLRRLGQAETLPSGSADGPGKLLIQLRTWIFEPSFADLDALTSTWA
jgi:hypothetical protein